MAYFTPPMSHGQAGVGYGHRDRRIPGLGDWNGAEHADGVESKRRIIRATRNERRCEIRVCVGDGSSAGNDPRRAAMACAAAWAVGMPVVFIGAETSPVGASALSIALKLFVTIAAAGASVGAIHGMALLWLLGRRTKARSRLSLSKPRYALSAPKVPRQAFANASEASRLHASVGQSQ